MTYENDNTNKNPAAAARGGELASDFTVCVHYDSRLYHEDIESSVAHARMLGRQSIIPADDVDRIVDGLAKIMAEIEAGEFEWDPELEDIHMNVEARLYELIGDAAGRLHTARSRNDQVATDTRLWTHTACSRAFEAAGLLQTALVELAEKHIETIVPGYTHMQRGQPVVLAHHLMAYFEMFDRDATRFAQAAESADVMPLGSGAMAGVPYPIDREWVADQLDFSEISRNSMDAVSDRDFIVEFLPLVMLVESVLEGIVQFGSIDGHRTRRIVCFRNLIKSVHKFRVARQIDGVNFDALALGPRIPLPCVGGSQRHFFVHSYFARRSFRQHFALLFVGPVVQSLKLDTSFFIRRGGLVWILTHFFTETGS